MSSLATHFASLQSTSAIPGAALRGVFTDIDDTLTRAGTLVPEAFAALGALKAAALRVVPVTGRPAGWAFVCASTWPVDAVVAENGGVAFIPEMSAQNRRVLRAIYWDDAATRAVQRKKLDAFAAEMTKRHAFAVLSQDQWLRQVDLAFDIGECVTLSAAEISVIQDAAEKIGARTTRSSIHLHIYFGDHDKAKMLARLMVSTFGDAPERVFGDYLFVGDSPNDASCFAAFAHTAGVANIQQYPQLAALAGVIATAEGGHGFAQIVLALLASSAISRHVS